MISCGVVTKSSVTSLTPTVYVVVFIKGANIFPVITVPKFFCIKVKPGVATAYFQR